MSVSPLRHIPLNQEDKDCLSHSNHTERFRNKDKMNPLRSFLPALLCLAAAQHAAAIMLFWTTTITIVYWDSSANRTVLQSCSDCGLYGLQSPVTSVKGKLTVPESHPQACDPHTSFNRTSRSWIALIERGNCTFSEKIRAASAQGASGVVIYNLPGTGDEVTPMVHHGKLWLYSLDYHLCFLSLLEGTCWKICMEILFCSYFHVM